MSPVQVMGEVLSTKRVGAYHAMTVVAPGMAEHVRPGHFVAVAVGGPEGPMPLRRAFALYEAQDRGVYGGTIEFVFAVRGNGTRWLADRRAHDPLDVVGPLGRPFALPKHPVHTVVVGGGYGSAPLLALAEQLRARGCRVDAVLGASTADRLFGSLDAKRMTTAMAITTEDGSQGETGRVTDVLPAMLDRGVDVVYACGPMGMLQAVAELGDSYGLPVQVAVEETMACGIGVCMTCVLPIRGVDGVTRMSRACIDGPVFMAEQVRFDAIGTVPDDALGAPVTPPRDAA